MCQSSSLFMRYRLSCGPIRSGPPFEDQVLLAQYLWHARSFNFPPLPVAAGTVMKKKVPYRAKTCPSSLSRPPLARGPAPEQKQGEPAASSSCSLVGVAPPPVGTTSQSISSSSRALFPCAPPREVNLPKKSFKGPTSQGRLHCAFFKRGTNSSSAVRASQSGRFLKFLGTPRPQVTSSTLKSYIGEPHTQGCASLAS